jgi:hypothetical protein
VLGFGIHTEIKLPVGLADNRGRRHQAAVLTPIAGRGELAAVAEANPFRAAILLLADSLIALGPHRGAEIDTSLLSGLLPIDRDYLLIQLSSITFGGARFQTVECPGKECGRRLDIRFDLRSIEAGQPSVSDHVAVPLDDGRVVLFRLPSSGDQVAAYGLDGMHAVDELLRRCILRSGKPSDAGSADVAGLQDVLAQEPAARVRLGAALAAAGPELDTSLELKCIHCEQPFKFVYDPVLTLIEELQASRSALLKEVHYLAFYYHWSHTEILSLTRPMRREYLELLDQELRSQTSGVAV